MKYLSLIILCLTFTACNNTTTTQTKEAENVAPVSTEVEDSTTESEVKFKSKGIQTIYDAYEKLRDALVETDYEKAKAFAAELNEALKSEESATQQASLASDIMKAGEIEMARTIFSQLNDAIEVIFEDAVESGELNKCYCPMALDNNGASWFSSTKEINNPYFGDKMLKCGTIKKTISNTTE